MLRRPGSHLTDSGHPTPCSPSWRACDYADKPSRENQRSIANDCAPQVRRGIIRQSALCLRTRPQTRDTASQKCSLLSHAARLPSRRSVHEPDPHCELAGANPFDYLTELQRHARELDMNPSEWMPWNYRETLARLAPLAAA